MLRKSKMSKGKAKAADELDLVLERSVKVPARILWKAWTVPEHLEKWFCPLPWKASEFTIELHPGGAFSSVMRGPAGEVMDNKGCYLEVVENKRLVWTSALTGGYRPAHAPFVPFTAIITFEEAGGVTHYKVRALHGDAAICKQHAEMGFHDGWGKAFDQLVAMAGEIEG